MTQKKKIEKKNKYLKALEDKRALVVGAGVSGIGSVGLLNRAGAQVTLLEQNAKKTFEEVAEKLDESDRNRTRIVIGEADEETLRDVELVVPSPGVPLDAPLMKSLTERGKRVISEIELAYLCAKGSLVAITGTNGKTTTTTLTGELLRQFYPQVFVVGNIGDPFTEHAFETKEESVTVAEISSFQLEAIDEFHANVSALLNVTPDHLDRHHTFERYLGVKQRISNKQTQDDVCVLNYMDKHTRAFGESGCPARVVWFSSGEAPPYGFWLSGDDILFVSDGRRDKALRYSDCNLVGRVGAENIMAALAIVTGLGFDFTDVVDRVKAFLPVKHRIEFIATKGGVDYYNDSKATNPDAAIHGIEAMTKPTILIGGGYDKGADYDEWIAAFDGKVKELVAIGQTKDAIADCAKKRGFTAVYTKANDFDEALAYCVKRAEAGDAVLLSPACASWDMFPNYEVRGDRFRAFVEGLD